MAARGLLPGIEVLRHYDRSWLRGDLLGGLTVAAYGIPQVMAYTEITGLPAYVGLSTMIGPLLVYAVLGSSRQLSVGPESTTALMTATAIGPIVAGLAAERRADAAATLAILVGLIGILAWLLRLGFLARLLSKPVLVGYLVGICVLMIGSQLGTVTGLPVASGGLVAQLMSLGPHLGSVRVPTLLVALAVLASLFAFRRWAPKLPGPLIVVLVAAAVVQLFDIPVGTIGSLEGGLPLPSLPNVTGLDLAAMVAPALGIALVGFSDNMLTARAFADRHGQRIDPSSELLAIGATNLIAGLSQGYPVSSSGSRAALGDSMGTRTQLHSLAAVVTIVAVVLFATPVLATFPVAALGGLVVYAALRLIDVKGIQRLAQFRWSEVGLAALTAAGVVLTDVLTGIAIAIAFSALDLLRRIADPHDGVLGFVPGVAGMHDIDDYPTATTVPGLIVYRYDGPLFFANADDFAAKCRKALAEEREPVRWFVLNAEAISEIDLTASDELERLRADLAEQGIVFGLARVKHDLYEQLDRAGIVESVGADRIYATLPTAVAAYRTAVGIEG